VPGGQVMRCAGRVAFVGLTLSLTACAIHPLPDDVTRESTYHIVQKIRCEAREALTKLAVRALRESHQPSTLDLAQQIEDGRLRVTEIFEKPHLQTLVDRQVHNNFDIFALSAVALAFTFTITEGNNNTANATFKMPFTNGLFQLTADAGGKLDRVAERKLEANHTFLELYELTDPAVCAKIAAGGGNFIYPITGKIGLEEVFETFYLMNRPYNPALKSPDDEAFKNHRAGRDVKDFSDELKFTTKFNMGATPSITLDPVPQKFRLTSASLTSSALREDLHKVVISVDIGDPVTSLMDARGRAGLRALNAAAQGAKRQASRRVKELRMENFISTVRDDLRQRGVAVD
jgi:hypothetical protein